jgi:hypothetical protein
MWRVVVCDEETSWNEKAIAALGCRARETNKQTHKQTTLYALNVFFTSCKFFHLTQTV